MMDALVDAMGGDPVLEAYQHLQKQLEMVVNDKPTQRNEVR